MNFTKEQIINTLTLLIVGVWLVTAVVRLFHVWPEARILDSIMPIVIGYWFLSASTKNSQDDDDKKGIAENNTEAKETI